MDREIGNILAMSSMFLGAAILIVSVVISWIWKEVSWFGITFGVAFILIGVNVEMQRLYDRIAELEKKKGR